jgi:serine/threonine protein phosphatase PrpC
MGCDGVWELMTGEEICQIVDEKFRQNPNIKVSAVMEEILDRGLSPDTTQGIGCDNMSGVIVQFRK